MPLSVPRPRQLRPRIGKTVWMNATEYRVAGERRMHTVKVFAPSHADAVGKAYDMHHKRLRMAL